MKKILLLTILLIAGITQAQNQNTINKMVESKTIEDIRTVSDSIVSKCKTKYNFYKILPYKGGSDESYQFVIYTKEGITELEKKEIYAPAFKNCFVVKFKEWNKAENKDLEIKGELVYYFKETSSKYLDIAPFWIATFYPKTTPELLLEDYNMKEYRVNKDLKYKLVKHQDIWQIVKSY
jgi:hypothetical protein